MCPHSVMHTRIKISLEGDGDMATWGAGIVRNDCVDKQASNGIIATHCGCIIEGDLVVNRFIIRNTVCLSHTSAGPSHRLTSCNEIASSRNFTHLRKTKAWLHLDAKYTRVAI